MISSDLEATNCLFVNNSNNSAQGAGGVMSLNSTEGRTNRTHLVNNTFFGNEAALGSVIGNWTDSIGVSVLTLQNNIFAGSLGASYEVENGTPEVISLGGNLSDDLSMETLASSVNDVNGEDPGMDDPALGRFGLDIGSPAIDSGVNAGAPLVDLNGDMREGIVDKGCFEFSTVATSVTPLSDKVTVHLGPNPVHERLSYVIDHPYVGQIQMVITSASGTVALQHNLTKSERLLTGDVKVGELQNGAYVLSFMGEKEIISAQFIKL